MGIKIFQMSNRCKNILGVIWVKKKIRCQICEKENFRCEMGIKHFRCQMGVQKF